MRWLILVPLIVWSPCSLAQEKPKESRLEAIVNKIGGHGSTPALERELSTYGRAGVEAVLSHVEKHPQRAFGMHSVFAMCFGPEAKEPLLRDLHSDKKGRQEAAVEGLKFIMVVAGEPSFWKKKAAGQPFAKSLAWIKSKDTLARVYKAARALPPDRFIMLVWGLGDLKDPGRDQLIIEALKSDDHKRRLAGINAVRIAGKDLTVLYPGLRSALLRLEDFDEFGLGLGNLGAGLHGHGKWFLEKLMADSNPRIRLLAANGLYEGRDKWAKAKLKSMENDPDKNVRTRVRDLLYKTPEQRMKEALEKLGGDDQGFCLPPYLCLPDQHAFTNT